MLCVSVLVPSIFIIKTKYGQTTDTQDSFRNGKNYNSIHRTDLATQSLVKARDKTNKPTKLFEIYLGLQNSC